MPVAVGVVIAIICLVVFSEWFYNISQGWSEMVLDDVYYKYRIAGVAVFSVFVIGATFFGMAFYYECPNEVREGALAGLRCQEYNKIVASTESILKYKN